MQLRDIMTPNPQCIRPEDTLLEAARQMRELDVGPLPVCDHDRLIGMITDRDITLRAVAEGRDPKTTPVRQAMTENIVSCFEDEGVAEAARLMEERQIRRLLVLNRDKRLVGIVSLGDLVVESGDRPKAGEILQEISEPSVPRREPTSAPARGAAISAMAEQKSQPLDETDPRRHTATIKAMLNDVIEHAREDADKVTDPKAQALFESTAEAVQGLVTAYEHFETQAEAAWR
jgi:CBS domain-containing protein